MYGVPAANWFRCMICDVANEAFCALSSTLMNLKYFAKNIWLTKTLAALFLLHLRKIKWIDKELGAFGPNVNS